MNKHKRIVIDLDLTLANPKSLEQNYADILPNVEVVKTLKRYRADGFYIIIHTARNMNTHNDNLGKINALTAPTIFEWLKKHAIEYDEIYFGKPWCGHDGFYVDDKAIRPSEFINLSYDEIKKIIK